MTNIDAYWVRIERLRTKGCLVIGPYPDEDAAELAMTESLLVEGFAQEDCSDCFTSTEKPGTYDDDEAVFIDVENPHHTGRGNDHGD